MSHVDFEYDSDTEDDCQDIDEIWYVPLLIPSFSTTVLLTNVPLGLLVAMEMLVAYVTPIDAGP